MDPASLNDIDSNDSEKLHQILDNQRKILERQELEVRKAIEL